MPHWCLPRALHYAKYIYRVLNRTFEPEAEERYAAYKRVKLREQVLKRIVNQIVSQSVSKPPLIAINTYTKYFAGEIVERARDVQEEYAKAYDKLLEEKWRERDKQKEQQQKAKESDVAPKAEQSTTNGVIKTEEDSPADQKLALLNGSSAETAAAPSISTTELSASNATATQEDKASDKVRKLPPPPHPLTSLSGFENPHRGGLLPEHLREALRRYRNDGEGGGVGFDGMSLGGLGVKGRRAWTVGGTFSGQGRRLFK